jgi:hypothetical protein
VVHRRFFVQLSTGWKLFVPPSLYLRQCPPPRTADAQHREVD